MSAEEERLPNFEAFWPYYMGEHSLPETRRLHYVGTCSAMGLVLLSAIVGPGWLAFFAVFMGYGPAWVSHFFIEKNRPATFKYPLWSLFADFKMLWLAARGRLPDELRRLSIPEGR